MGIFDDDDDFLNDDDFMNRWEKFNNRMVNDEEFRKEMEKAQKDFQELMRMLLTRKPFDAPLDFRIIPLNTKNDLDIPGDEMRTQRGKDENGEWETKNWVSPDGSITYSSFSRSSGPGDLTNSDDIAENWGRKGGNSEEIKNLKLKKLQIALDKAVEQESYERAAEIKKIMDELKSEKKG